MTHAPLRILVFDLPPLLRDLVLRALDANDDMSIVIAEAGELERAIAGDRPDAIIAAVNEDGLEPESRRLLENRARQKVLGIEAREGSAVLYELVPQRSELGAVVPDELATHIRTALARTITV